MNKLFNNEKIIKAQKTINMHRDIQNNNPSYL